MNDFLNKYTFEVGEAEDTPFVKADGIRQDGTTGTYSITDGALLLDDGDAENSAMAMKYYVPAPSSYNAAVLEFDFKLTQSYGSYPVQIKLAGLTHTIYIRRPTMSPTARATSFV